MVAQRRCRRFPAQVAATHVFGRRSQWNHRLECFCEMRELDGGILGGQQPSEHVRQRLTLAMLSEAAHGARGRLAIQAGSLLGVKEEGMIEQQAQGQASA